MTKKATGDASQPVIDQSVVERMADPSIMLHATQKANAGRATAYNYGGSLGDSIERRLAPGMDGLGGGYDVGHGLHGNNTAYPAVGYGNFYGAGLGFGPQARTNVHFGSVTGAGAGGYQYLRRYAGQSSLNHSIIAACILAYLGYGVVRNIIDLYADFATEGLMIEHPQKSIRNFYNAWAKKVRLNERIHNIFMNLFITGNVFVHRRWADLDNSDERAMKRTEATEIINDKLVIRGKSRDRVVDPSGEFLDWYLNSKGQSYVDGMLRREDKINRNSTQATPISPEEEVLPKNNSSRIPWGYTTMNPLQMDVRGSKLRGEHYWVMLLDRRDTLEIAKGLGMYSSSTKDLGVTEVNLPKEFVRKVKPISQGIGGGYVAEIRMDEEDLSVIQDRKMDWFSWAPPFVAPALRALSFKDCLRDMETRACYSVINSIFLFKLGDLQNGMPAEEEHFERLADMLQQPGQVMNVIWNEAIEADVIQADIKNIFDPKKHESADKDILTALGVPEVLLGGKGGNFSNSFIAVSTILERLESARGRVMDWLMGEFKLIADAMGFQKLPNVKFGQTSLTDRKAEQTFMFGLFDRGILSADDLLNMADTDFEMQVAKQKEEKELQEKKSKVMEYKGPYIKEPKPAPGAAGGPSKPKTPNGRPAGSDTGPTGKQSNPRAPKGQNVTAEDMIVLVEHFNTIGRQILDDVEKGISDRMIRMHNDRRASGAPYVRYVKSLPKSEKDRLENLVYNVFSHIGPNAPEQMDTDDFLVHFLESSSANGIKVDVLETYDGKLKAYQEKWGKPPAREHRRQMMVSSWTQFAITQHLEGSTII